MEVCPSIPSTIEVVTEKEIFLIEGGGGTARGPWVGTDSTDERKEFTQAAKPDPR